MNYNNLAKIFSKKSINCLIDGNFDYLRTIVEAFPKLAQSTDLVSLYESAYKILSKTYRNEYLVKNEIANKLFISNYSFKTTSMLSELCVGQNIADCIIINNKSTGYEIKTEFDSLFRLADQLDTYLKVFDRTFIVAHKKHINNLINFSITEPNFGIIELTERNSLKIIKDAPLNRPFDKEIMFSSLRKQEYTYIAEKILCSELPTMPNSLIYKYCKNIFLSADLDLVNNLYKSALRLFRKNDSAFIETLPKSMKNIGISVKLNKKEKTDLVKTLYQTHKNFTGESPDVFSLFERKTA